MYDKSILLDILLKDVCRTLDNTGKPYPPSAFIPPYHKKSRSVVLTFRLNIYT